MDNHGFRGPENPGRRTLGAQKITNNPMRQNQYGDLSADPNPVAERAGMHGEFQQQFTENQPGYDYSYGAAQQQVPTRVLPSGIDPQQLLNNPMVANMALQYGNELADQGKTLVNQKLEKYISVSRLKYYFAVDTAYVLKKLKILLFPFTHSDWSVQFNQEEPVAPRYDVNAPDLYIPVMALVTYILVAGITLGTQNRFSPEQLGILASSVLAWECFTIFVILISLYIMDIMSDLKTFDIIAFCGYKYVGMISALIAYLSVKMTGYYIALAYTGVSITFFLMRTLRVLILNKPDAAQYRDSTVGRKRGLYMLLFISGVQPILMYWLSCHLVA